MKDALQTSSGWTRGFHATALWLTLAVCPGSLWAATDSGRIPVVPKWERFEHAFTSVAAYANPLQDLSLTVQFTSPLGETTPVFGFWDGGRTWRVRFAPNQPGRWTFKTVCSDPANMGLNDQTGTFLCSASLNQTRFFQHGPIRVAGDRQHLEHADGTPFFWLADTVWNGARVSEPRSWEIYGLVRSSQGFTVAQWAATPGGDFQGQSALTGFPERIGVNPEFFSRMDAKVASLGEVGILSAIAPIWRQGPQAPAVELPESQKILLVRYMVARWGADPVAWLIPLDGAAKSLEEWNNIGRAVFTGIQHGPVLAFSTENPEALNGFRDQDWVDLLGLRAPLPAQADALLATLTGDALDAGSRNLRHPIIAFTPEENSASGEGGARISAAQVRNSAYWGVLAAHAAGITYSGYGLVNWDTTVEQKTEDKLGAGLPFWHKVLFMPGAKQMGHLAGLLGTLDYWTLRAAPGIIAGSSADASSPKAALAACNPTKSLALVYVPEGRMLDLSLDDLPHAPAVTWYNPRQGENSPAVAVVVQRTCQFPTPDQGDWLLLLKAGKP